jgi:hypothetical protein
LRELIAMDPVGEITRYLDKTDDGALLILRTHLLVEERLRDVLARICRAPDELRAARLSFHQVPSVCRAVVGRRDEPAWDFVARLNEVRNGMAHHLDPGDLACAKQELKPRYESCAKWRLLRWDAVADKSYPLCGEYDSDARGGGAGVEAAFGDCVRLSAGFPK